MNSIDNNICTVNDIFFGRIFKGTGIDIRIKVIKLVIKDIIDLVRAILLINFLGIRINGKVFDAVKDMAY